MVNGCYYVGVVCMVDIVSGLNVNVVLCGLVLIYVWVLGSKVSDVLVFS